MRYCEFYARFANDLKLFLIFLLSAILVTWLIVITTAFPVFLTHGEVEYPGHNGEINMACLFLTEHGYNHAAFQVSEENYEKLLISIFTMK